MAQTAAHGAAVKIGDGATSETFNDIASISSGPDGPALLPQIIQSFTHDATNPTKKVSFVDIGPITFTVDYDSDDTQHALLVTNASNKTLTNFQMVLADTGAEQIDFEAAIEVSWSAPVDGFNQLNVTLTVTGGSLTIS